MKVSPLAARIATRYMLQKVALAPVDGPPMGGQEPEAEGAPPAETAGQDMTAMPKSKVGQQALLEAIEKLQEAFDNLDDKAFQQQLKNLEKLSVPGQEVA